MWEVDWTLHTGNKNMYKPNLSSKNTCVGWSTHWRVYSKIREGLSFLCPSSTDPVASARITSFLVILLNTRTYLYLILLMQGMKSGIFSPFHKWVNNPVWGIYVKVKVKWLANSGFKSQSYTTCPLTTIIWDIDIWLCYHLLPVLGPPCWTYQPLTYSKPFPQRLNRGQAYSKYGLNKTTMSLLGRQGDGKCVVGARGRTKSTTSKWGPNN